MHLVIGSILLILGALMPVSSMAAQVEPKAARVKVDVKGVNLVKVLDNIGGVVRVSLQGPRKDTKATLPHHLYLVIDNSQSMFGKRIKAVEQALLAVNDYLKKNASDLPVTIITFNDEAKVEFEGQTTEKKLTSLIRADGGTNFVAPVKLLIDEIDKSSAIPLAILLTDGEASNLNSKTFAPLKGFQVELIGVGANADVNNLEQVAMSLNTGVHYLADNTKVLSTGSPEQGTLESLLQLHLSRINDVVVGSVTINAHIPEGSSAKFTGSSLGSYVIYSEGRHIKVTIPSLADEEEKVVDFYTQGEIHGEISVNCASKQAEFVTTQEEFVTTRMNDFNEKISTMKTYEELNNAFKRLSDDLNQKYPVPEYEDLIDVQEKIAQFMEALGRIKNTPDFKIEMPYAYKESVERNMIATRYAYAQSAKADKKLRLEEDEVFEKTFVAQEALKAKTEGLKKDILTSTSNNDLIGALKAFMGELEQDANHELVAELLSAVDEMAKEFKAAAEKGIELPEAKRFLLASIHNGAHKHVSNTPGASQGTKAQKSFKEKFLDSAKNALIGAGKSSSAVEAYGSVLSGLSSGANGLKPSSQRNIPAKTSEKTPEANGSSFSRPALKPVGARNAPAVNAPSATVPSTTAEQAPAGFTSSSSIKDIRSKFEKKD